VFSEGADSKWLLKGGTGMLARLPSTRTTLDIDLYRDGFTLDQAIADLRRLADTDLGSFEAFIGPRNKGSLNVDLAVGAGLTAPVVCATMQTYHERPSSREKDLVDLVVLAVTQNVDGTALGIAISTEARRRLMEPFDHFAVPSDWGRRYAKLAKPVPYCAAYSTVDLARDLVTRFIDPSLDGGAAGKTWTPETRSWSDSERAAAPGFEVPARRCLRRDEAS